MKETIRMVKKEDQTWKRTKHKSKSRLQHEIEALCPCGSQKPFKDCCN